jgi:hypothetical protein
VSRRSPRTTSHALRSAKPPVVAQPKKRVVFPPVSPKCENAVRAGKSACAPEARASTWIRAPREAMHVRAYGFANRSTAAGSRKERAARGCVFPRYNSNGLKIILLGRNEHFRRFTRINFLFWSSFVLFIFIFCFKKKEKEKKRF